MHLIRNRHRHAAFEEGIYVLDGSIRATLDGETYEAQAGSFLIIPWGLPHEIRNTVGSAARLLLLSGRPSLRGL